jgi:excisionase family DNA binding protein
MSAQSAVGRSLPTRPLSPEPRTRKGNWKWTAIGIVAAAQPLAVAPAALTLAEQIERTKGAMTAEQLAKILNVSKITIFKQAKAGRIPSFRIGTCVRFDPKAVAKWLRTM